MESSTTEPVAGLAPYQYQPLEEKEIRILMLEPGAFGEPLRGYFQVLHLGDNLLRPTKHGLLDLEVKSADHSASEDNEDYFDGGATEISRENRSTSLQSTELPAVPRAWYYTEGPPEESAPSPKRPWWWGSANNSDSDSEMNSVESEAQKYCAISYAWGFSERPHCIYLDDTSFVSITDSLFQALQRFRWRNLDRPLWADALCINQGDNNEKSGQVALMGAIYSFAWKVLIWLGESEGLDWLAFAVPKAARSMRLRNDESIMYSALVEERHQCQCCLARSFGDGKETYKHALIALKSILNRKWFERLWTFQEIQLARRSYVQSGEHEMSFVFLREQLHRLGQDHFTLAQRLLEPFTLNAMRRFDTDYRSEKHPFVEVIMDCRAAQCGDPRDRIYAIRNLADMSAWTENDVDYNLAPVLVFRSATVNCLRHDSDTTNQFDRPHSSALLAYAGSTHAQAAKTSEWNLPSWVPDYTRLTTECEMICRRMVTNPALDGWFPASAMRVSKEFQHNGWQHHGLRLGGRVIGKVTSVLHDSQASQGLSEFKLDPRSGPVIVIGSSVVGTTTSLQIWAQRCGRFMKAPMSTGLGRILAEAPDDLEQHRTGSKRPALQDWHRRRSEGYTPAVHSDNVFGPNIYVRDAQKFRVQPDSTNFLTRPLDPLDSIPRSVEYTRALLSSLADSILSPRQLNASCESIISLLAFDGNSLQVMGQDRLLAAVTTTTGGAFFGWVPRTTQAGDILCIFYGAPFPFVLRSAKGLSAYTVVGDAVFPHMTEETAVAFDVGKRDTVLLI